MADDSDEGEGVAAGTLFGILTQATTALFTAALTVYLVRALGAGGYGLFSLGISIIGLGMLFSDLAISPSAARYIADRRGDRAGTVEVIASALAQKLVLAAGAGAALALLAGPIAGAYGKPGLEGPLRGFALSLVGESLLWLWTHTFIALRRLRLNAITILVESAFEASASIAFVVLGAGVTGAALGRAIGYVVGALLGGILLARLAGRRALDPRSGSPQLRRRIRVYARPLFAATSAYTAYSVIDTQLIAVLLSTTAVGVWAAPLRLLTLIGYVSLAVATAVAPRMSSKSPEGPDVRAFNVGLRWLVVLHAALVVPVVVWADPIVGLVLGDEFRASADVLRAMGVLVILLGISPLASTTVNFLGQASRRIPIVLFSLGVNAVLDLILLPAIGVLGAVIGTTVAYGIYVPAHLRLCRRAFEVPLAPLARTAARAGLAALAGAAVLLAFGTSDLAAWQWVAGLAGGLVAFVAVLVATGELTPAELRAVRGAVRGRRG